MKLDRNQLTFSQAEGLIPLPRQLGLGELSNQLRNELWSIIYDDLSESVRHGYSATISSPWREILKNIHVKIINRPIDEFDAELSFWKDQLKSFFFKAEYNLVLDLIIFLIREKNFKSSVKMELEQALIRHQSSYRIKEHHIIPVTSEFEGQSIELALSNQKLDQFTGAKTHLLKAGENLSLGNYADSIRDSIHAVESVCCIISEKGTLSSALKVIEKRYPIHAALKEALYKIYAYTNDEKGLRHSLLDQSDAKVDESDAIFMFGACASFVSYLINKSNYIDGKK